MDDKEIEYAIKGIERLYPQSFQDFKDYGDKAIYAFEKGVEDASNFAKPEEILEESGQKAPNFSRIMNLLSRAEVLPTWNDSAPFRIDTNKYDSELLKKAYNEATGEEYSPPRVNNWRPQSLFDDPSDDALNSIQEYETEAEND